MDATEKMGRMITEIVKNDENAVITAGVDTYTETPNDYPVFDSVEKCTEDADVVIDFFKCGSSGFAFGLLRG